MCPPLLAQSRSVHSIAYPHCHMSADGGQATAALVTKSYKTLLRQSSSCHKDLLAGLKLVRTCLQQDDHDDDHGDQPRVPAASRAALVRASRTLEKSLSMLVRVGTSALQLKVHAANLTRSCHRQRPTRRDPSSSSKRSAASRLRRSEISTDPWRQDLAAWRKTLPATSSTRIPKRGTPECPFAARAMTSPAIHMTVPGTTNCKPSAKSAAAGGQETGTVNPDASFTSSWS